MHPVSSGDIVSFRDRARCFFTWSLLECNKVTNTCILVATPLVSVVILPQPVFEWHIQYSFICNILRLHFSTSTFFSRLQVIRNVLNKYQYWGFFCKFLLLQGSSQMIKIKHAAWKLFYAQSVCKHANNANAMLWFGCRNDYYLVHWDASIL